MLRGQMSPWQLGSVKDGPKNLPLKFGQNRASNSWDIAYIEFSGGGSTAYIEVPQHICVKSFSCKTQTYKVSTKTVPTFVCWTFRRITFKIPPPPLTTQTQCRQYLSCYWPDFDQTLKVGSWEHLEQVPTVTVTFVQATFVLATFVHIRNISAVTDPILTKL